MKNSLTRTATRTAAAVAFATAAIAIAPAAHAAEAPSTDAGASAAEANEATTVSIRPSVATRPYASTERVSIAVHATNTDSVPVRIKITTPFGEKAWDAVAPGASVYQELTTGKGSVPAGKVTFVAYAAARDGAPARYTSTTKTYDAEVATLAPRGTANANGWIHPQDGGVYLSGYFTNTGADPVSVRYKTTYGDSAAQTVQPGKSAYLTVKTGMASVPAGSAVVAAYKYVDGKGYYTEIPVTTPALVDAAPVVKILSPSAGTVAGESLTVTGSATDDIGIRGELVTLHLRALQDNGKCGAFFATQVAPVAADGAWSATFDTSALAPGSYCVTALANDVFGTQNVGGGTHLKSFVVEAPVVEVPVVEAPEESAPAALPDAEAPAPEETSPLVVPDAVVPDAVVPDAVVPDAVVPDAVVPAAVVPEAVVPEAATPELASPVAAPAATPAGTSLPVVARPAIAALPTAPDAAAPASGSATPVSRQVTAAPAAVLAATGSDDLALTGFAAALVLGGGGALVLADRRLRRDAR